jgi:hypothetical protein
MTDILQRLGAWCPHEDECPRVLIDEAAEEIERLRAELAAANKHIEELEKTAFYIPRKQPCADRDRELRERLVESALQGVNVSGLHRSEAELIGKASVWMVEAAIAAMRKGERDAS